MKLNKLFIIISIICLLFVSCKKDIDDTIVPVTLTIKADYENSYIGPETQVTYSVVNSSEYIADENIYWSVNGSIQSVVGKQVVITVPSSTEGQMHEVYALACKDYVYYPSNKIVYTYSEKAQLYADLENNIKQYLKLVGYEPGVTVSVYSKDKGIDFNFATGYSSISNKTKNTLSTLHPICSITKSFTAAAIEKMVIDGDIKLSDKVSELLSGHNFNKDLINIDATVADLLTHTSGIADFVGVDLIVDMMSKYPFISAVLKTIGRSGVYPYENGWSPEISLKYEIHAANKAITQTKIENRPKSAYEYSSANYVLLGMIIEEKNHEGLTYEQYVRKYFMDPIGIGGKLFIAPRENVNYNSVASPHMYVNSFTQYLDAGLKRLLTIIGIKGEGPNDVSKYVPDAQEILGKIAWAGGSILGSSNPVAQWGYYLLSPYGGIDYDDSNPELSYFKTIRTNIYNTTSRKLESAYPWYYNDGIDASERTILDNQGNPFSIGVFGHAGNGIGTWNHMYYNMDTDACYVVLTDASEQGGAGGFNITLLSSILMNEVYHYFESLGELHTV